MLCFGTVKTVPSLCEMDKNCPCVVCLKWYEMNGLSCVELNRLIHYFNVLVQCHNYMELNCVCRPLS